MENSKCRMQNAGLCNNETFKSGPSALPFNSLVFASNCQRMNQRDSQEATASRRHVGWRELPRSVPSEIYAGLHLEIG
jgi:hypothetical protein